MMVIAITGGIGSGKSTVRKLFEKMGASGIDTDELARKAVEEGSEGARRIREAFGPSYFDEKGELDRQRMAERVFSDSRSLRKLESILHPIIREKEQMIIEELKNKAPEIIIVVEIPLLAEGDRAEQYDLVVNVTAPEKIRLDRLVKSGKYSRKEAKDRIANQANNETRASIAHYTIDNGNTVGHTEAQVRKITGSL